MRIFTMSARRSPDMTSTAFLIIAFLTGISGALHTPPLRLFLSPPLHLCPLLLGRSSSGRPVFRLFLPRLRLFLLLILFPLRLLSLLLILSLRPLLSLLPLLLLPLPHFPPLLVLNLSNLFLHRSFLHLY